MTVTRLSVNNLLPETDYAVRVRAVSHTEMSAWSTIQNFTTIGDTISPMEPTGVTWAALGDTFHGAWDPVTQNVAGETIPIYRYEVELGANGTTKIKSVVATTGFTKVTFDLSYAENRALFGTPQSTITFRVRSVDNKGRKSDWSTPLLTATNGAPGAPTNGVGTPIIDGVELSWTPPSDNDLARFEVHASTTDGFTANAGNLVGTVSDQATSFTYYTSTYTNHYFQVFAIDTFGLRSAPLWIEGEPISPFFVDVTPPDAPTGVTVTSNYDVQRQQAYLDVSWAANTEDDLQEYTVRYGPSATGPWSHVNVATGSTSTRIYATAGQTYYVELRAMDASANPSAYVPATNSPIVAGADSAPPAQVTGLTATPVGTTFVSTWTASTANDLRNYEIGVKNGTTEVFFFSNSTRFDFTLDMNRLAFTTPKAALTFRVRAIDHANNAGPWSADVVATNAAPAAPTALLNSIGANSISIRWTAPADADVVGYNIYQGTTANPTTKVAFNNGTEFTAVVNNTTPQYFSVKAVDAFGTESAALSGGPFTATNPFIVDTTAPAVPTGLAATVTNNVDGRGAFANVSWTAVSATDLAGYVVRYRKTGSSDTYTTLTVDKGATAARIELPVAYTQYSFAVRAFDNSANYSANSAEVAASPAANGAPGQVTGVTSTPNRDSITYNWTALADLDLKTYEVTVSTSPTFASGNTTFYTGTATVLHVGGMTPATTYHARVRGIDVGDLAGAWSATHTKATLAQLSPGDIGAPTAAELAALEGRVDDSVNGYVVEYALNSSETTPPITSDPSWSTTPPTRTPGTFIWERVTVTYSDSTTNTTSPVLTTGNTGAAGSAGTPAPVIALTATTQVLTSPATGGATTPTTSVVTGTAANTTISVWQYSVDGAAFSNTVPTGVSRTGNVVTVTGSTMTARTITVRMADAAGIADTMTVAKVSDGATGSTGGTGGTGPAGADAYTVILTNEANVFAGSTTAALAGSTTTQVIAYKGATQQTATIGAITGQVTGLTTAITNNGTTTAGVTVTVTTALTATSGELTIPITVDGKAFTKKFSWSVGRAGADGSQGIQGPPGNDGTSLYTWLKYADTPTTGMADDPTGKTYMGVAYNKTSATESSNYADYQWSLIKGADGSAGAAGKGISTTTVTYQKHTNGTTAPTGTWTTAIPSTVAGEFLWTRTYTTYTDATDSTAYSVAAHGATGSAGTAGRGISGTVVEYQKHTNGTTAPTGTWTTAIPATSPGEYLWTRTVITYTSGTPTTTTSYAVSAHGATGGQGIQGPPGNDGQPTYTWIKYADDAVGTGLADTPTGKTYIGLAHNKTTATESTTPGDYQWSLIQGPAGSDGAPAPVITVTATTQALTSPATGGATTPATSVVTGTALNTTISTVEFSVNGGAWVTANPTGVTGTGNTRTITGSTMTANTIAVRMSGGGTSDTLTVAKIANGAAGSNGTNGVGITGTTVTYQVHTNGTTAPTGTWQTTPQATVAGQFLWTRTITNYSDTSSSTAYSVAAHGSTGSAGTAGNGITGTTVTYQKHTNGTTAPTGTWVTSPPATVAGEFLWTRTVTSYSASADVTAYSVAAHGATGNTGSAGRGVAGTTVNYAKNTSGTTEPTTGWGTAIPTTTTGEFLWTRTVTTYTDGLNPTTAYSVSAHGATGSAGTNGVGISSTVVNYTKSTSGTVEPTTGWGTTIPSTVPGEYLWTRTVVTYTSGNPTTSYSVAAHGATGDAGADAYTVMLTNEAMTFPGSTTAALGGSEVSNAIGYKGTAQQSITIGTITGQIAGQITAAVTGSPGTSPTITVTVTTALTAQSGTLTVPVTIDGRTFNKIISWSVTRQGATGGTGGQGNPGTSITAVTPFYAVVATGAAAPAQPTTQATPPAPWVATEPTWTANTELYRTERITYSNSTYTYTTVVKVSSYAAAAAAMTAANGKNKIMFSTGTPSGTAYVDGDIWYQKSGSDIIGVWEFVSGLWQARTLRDEVLKSISVGKLVSGSVDTALIKITNSGSIQSDVFTQGSVGWRLNSTGLEINDGSVKASALIGDTLGSSTGTIEIATGANIRLNGGYIKSATNTGTTMATAETSGVGFYLGNDGLFVGGGTNGGRIKANALISDTLTSTTITLGTGGIIQTLNYNGTSGFKLDSTGLSIPDGSLQASKLLVTAAGGNNLWTNSSFEKDIGGGVGYFDGWNIYSNDGVSSASRVTGRTGGYAARVSWSAASASPQGLHRTIPGGFKTGVPYTLSWWAKGSGSPVGKTFNIHHNAPTPTGIIWRSNPALSSTAWQRYVVTFYRTDSNDSIFWGISNTAAGTNYIDFDDVQIEESELPSGYSPFTSEILAGVTSIDGGMIKTGSIISTSNTGVGGTPLWSIPMNGSATFQNLTVRGSSIVGASGDGTSSLMRSFTYSAGANGWIIYASGAAEFNDVTVRGTVYASGGSFTGAVTATSGSFTGAITASSGSITGNLSITGSGKILVNGTTGARIEIGATTIKGYNASSVNTFTLDGTTGGISSTGPFTLQNASITVGTGSISGTGFTLSSAGVVISNSGGSTSIDGSVIKTGTIQSLSTVTYGGTTQPKWAIGINGTGAAVFADASVRGRLVVGIPDTLNQTGELSYIQSGNYSPGVSGWKIDAQGNVEFAKGTFRTAVSGERVEIASVTGPKDLRFYSGSAGEDTNNPAYIGQYEQGYAGAWQSILELGASRISGVSISRPGRIMISNFQIGAASSVSLDANYVYVSNGATLYTDFIRGNQNVYLTVSQSLRPTSGIDFTGASTGILMQGLAVNMQGGSVININALQGTNNSISFSGQTISGGPTIGGGPSVTGGLTVSAGLTLNHLSGTGQRYVVTGASGVITAGAATSSIKFKRNLENLDHFADAAVKLEPYAFDWVESEGGGRAVGFIAEYADELGLEPWVGYNEDGTPYGFDYPMFVVAQQAVLRKQHADIENLEDKVARLEELVNSLVSKS